jgi:hypothetical protein
MRLNSGSALASKSVQGTQSKSKQLLKKVLLKIARNELDIELKRQYLASHEHFEPY